MDRLDRISTGAIVVLAVWAVVLLMFNGGGQGASKDRLPGKGQEVQRYIDPNFDTKLALAKKLIASGSIEQAGLLVDELLKNYAFEGQPYMLKGDIFLRKQQPVQAMSQYRKAIDLNPDFLDKKTTVFQGKKIKKTVDEAQVLIDEALAENPGNEEQKEYKKMLYYMLRKIAGSCS
nr:hypothetical protein [Desulfobulbaceae bacterium]